ncbi:MAG: hypothetical protein ACFFBR_09385 [Promethearchaeota archaeon]
MERNSRLEDRLEVAMGFLAFVGVGIAMGIPFILIFSSILLHIPYLEVMVLICQVGGCIMTGIALGYFICRKEM